MTRPDPDTPAPIPAIADLDRIFACVATAPAILLAVSGGPDSMALLVLATQWARSRGPRLHVATVDHGLRAGSQHEARMVASAAQRLGVPHRILSWVGDKPTARIQERARDARYALLAAHAREVQATAILTAHHADDQAETVLFRLSRGSGLKGLAGMRRKTALTDDVSLMRPLLSLRKTDLVAICLHAGISFSEDPSNSDPRFHRVRLRDKAAAIKALGLDAPILTRLAERAARADAALEAEAEKAEARLICDRSDQGVSLDLAGSDLPSEILQRVVGRAIGRIVGGGKQIRLERLERLCDSVERALRAGMPHRATLGSALVRLGADKRLRVEIEGERRRGRDANR